MTNSYDDIIHLPHHVSKSRPQMPVIDRAAQFSPFAALTGYDSAIKEASRRTCERVELDDSIKDVLSYKLQVLSDRIKEYIEISITYFKPDSKKDGGSYQTATGTISKIDINGRIVTMTDGIEIPIDEIINIDGTIFENILV